MTDMTSKAVTERLRLMDELWLLSVKLMNSKAIAKHASQSRNDRVREVQDFCGEETPRTESEIAGNTGEP